LTSSFDLIIIGAGVVGAAIARELSRYKIDIALLEKEPDVSFGTSKANSGIIHAGFHSPPGSLKAKLCVAGNRMFDRLSEELNVPFERRGELVVAFGLEESRILQELYVQGKKNNVQYLELLGRERTLEIEPNLNPDVSASLYAPTAGIIGPYELCYALSENAADNGVELLLNKKVSNIQKKGSLQIYCEDGSKYKTKYLVNAAGLFADEITEMLGLKTFKIRPRKGEEYLLDKRVGDLVQHVIFPVPGKTSKGMLIIPTIDGPVMVGPTADDIERKDDFTTSKDGLERVFNHAQKMIPQIRSNDIITAFAGLRPAAEGGDFIIGRTEIPGVINVAGIQSPGLTASPAIAEMVRDLLLQEGLKLTANPSFTPIRPAHPHCRNLIDEERMDELEALIREDPAYARLVCRCEKVTEAEIIAAVRKGHVTLDSLKFTTRALSGRCQGGFCTHRILQIIHRETGIPIEKISKKGPGSEIVLAPLKKGDER
jgi:glycerol-3-phosphate dehydrogenase